MNHLSNRTSLAATALAVFLLCLAIPTSASTETGAAEDFVLRNAVGKIEIGSGRPLVWRAATPDTPPRAGDRIRTGDRSKVEVAWGNQTVRLFANSILRLPDAEKKAGVERGNSLIDVFRKNGKPSPFEMTAEDIVVVVKGTRFGVDLTKGDAVHVAVYEGEVQLHDPADAEAFPVSVRPGYVARMGGGLTPMVALHSGEDPWANWSSRVATTPPAATDPKGAKEAARDAIRGVERNAIDDHGLAGGGLDPRSDPVPLDPAQDVRDPGAALGGSSRTPGIVTKTAPIDSN